MHSPDLHNRQRGFYISATKKSSGKTVISLGLGGALTERGYRVQPYKKGPDYIDPMWHRAATARACYNLDFFTQSHAEIQQTFDRNRDAVDIVYVEGNKGLFDGMDTLGSDSNASLAVQLGLPVVLIVNAQGITRGIAPMLVGYENFCDGINFAGIILNEIAGPRHEQKLIAAVNEYTDLQVLGVVPRLASLHLEERHLGLVPQNEAEYSNSYIQQASKLVREHVDIDLLLSRSAELALPAAQPAGEPVTANKVTKLKIAVAKDRAFGFYYPDDLEAMERQGAELVFIDTQRDVELPLVDALFIGGGFPEMQMDALERNRSMRESIRCFVESGKPVYAECGGLMYLCREISYAGRTASMVGAIDARVTMMSKPIGRGYAIIQATRNHLWGDGSEQVLQRRCHEFHYSMLEELDNELPMAYHVQRGYGVDGDNDGIMLKNTLANYCHQRATENNPWVAQFIQFIRRVKDYESN